MTDRNLTPWYGTANLETGEPTITSCGRTCEPVRMPGGDDAVKEMLRARMVKDGAESARTMSEKMSFQKVYRDALEKSRMPAEWTHYEI